MEEEGEGLSPVAMFRRLIVISLRDASRIQSHWFGGNFENIT